MEGWGSWALLYFPRLQILCCMAAAAGTRVASVCGVVWVAPVGEIPSVGLSATIPIVIMVGASIGWRVVQADVVAGQRVQGVPSKVAAYLAVWIGVGLWSALMSPMSVTIIRVWSVPPVVGVSMPWMRSFMVMWCSWWRNLVGAVLGKMTKFITVITLGIRAVAAKMTCPSADKTLIITTYHNDCGRS